MKGLQFGFKKVGKEFVGNRFMAFGAAGEVTIRECESYDVVEWEQGPVVLVYLKAKEYTSSWNLESIVPLNRKAKRLMAYLIWKRDMSKYKEWRKKYKKGTFPSFKKMEREIDNIILGRG